MKKIRFFLQKKGVSMVDGGVINHKFEYEYDTQMTVLDLVNLFTKVYTDIQKEILKHDSAEGFTVVFNYLVHTDDISICRFFKGWLEGTKEGEKKLLESVILIEKDSKF